jgi:16S rRNA G966 N2-methylase RsmD
VSTAEQPNDLAPEGVYLAENLEFLRGVRDDSIDLVYTDPPFGTGQTRRLQSIRTGTGQRTRSGFGGRKYRYDVASDRQYSDDMPLDDYLAFLEARLQGSRHTAAN